MGIREKFGMWIVTTGLDYEAAVAEVFSKLGYQVMLTSSSGDQGVDLIASTDGVKIAVQCKLYTGNHVGNDAVQQVYAGKSFYGCSDAWVVSNSEYTKSAKELAAKLEVKLLHHDQLLDVLPKRYEPIGIWGIPSSQRTNGKQQSWQ